MGFEDTRGTLFFDIARILKAKKPSLLLLENVKGFKSHDRGNTFLVVISTLESLGYEVHTQILNARDFGLPQNRERIYIVGINRKKTLQNEFRFPKPSHKETRLGKILEKNVDEKYTISDRLWRGHKRRLREHRAKGNGFGYSLFD
jgi:DNA (cytosine-5)-methyltransferase 1